MNKNTKDDALSTERALKLALKSLEGLADYRYTERVKQTLAAIREALAEPSEALMSVPEVREQQEPDYNICPTCGGMASDPIVPPEHRQQSTECVEPVAFEIRAFNATQVFIKRADVAQEKADVLEREFGSEADVTIVPLYTSPPYEATPLASQRSVKPWVGLTDEHRREVINAAWNGYLRGEGNDSFSWHLTQVIEAKLREKNEHREKNA